MTTDGWKTWLSLVTPSIWSKTSSKASHEYIPIIDWDEVELV